MAKKTTNGTGAASKAAAKTTTPVRNSAIPKTSPAAKAAANSAPAPREISHEMIAKRAYEISISGSGGSEFDNWIRAERELRGA